MNPQRLQQAVFRMQHDAAFAERVFAGDPEAIASLDLDDAEHRLLRAPGAASFAADREGRRRAQFLRNVSSEFRAACARGPDGDGARAWIEGFAESEEFHHCVTAGDERLALAFGRYAARRADTAGDAGFRALVRLERAMAQARRALAGRPHPRPGEIGLAPWAHLCAVPEGTHALAAALQSPRASAGRPVDASREEVVLLVADEREAPPGGLRGVRAEVLAPLVALFLQAAETPRPRDAGRHFARAHDLDPALVEEVARDFLAERVLLAAD